MDSPDPENQIILKVTPNQRILNCENWKTVFPKYSKIFEVQKEIILQKASNMSGHSQEHQSVLQKLEQNKKLAADQNAHTAGLHKGRNGPVK